MKTSEGERIRIKQGIDRMRTILDQVASTLDVDAPPSPDVAQAVAHAGVDLACTISRLAAYMRAEEHGERCGDVLRGDGDEQYVCHLDRAHTVSGSAHTDAMGLAYWPVQS